MASGERSIARRRRGVPPAVFLAAWASASACGGQLAPEPATHERDASATNGTDTGVADGATDGAIRDGSAEIGDASAEVAPDVNDGSSCGTCPPNESCVAGVCKPGAPVPPPRPVAPLSTATVTSQTPLLRWALASGSDGAVVDVCRDRACTTTLVSFSALGTSGTLPAALTAGVYYWRLHGTLNGLAGAATSPVWELFVGPRSAPVSTSWGTTLDVNGDGFADVAVGAPQSNNQAGAAYVYLGGRAGLSSTPTTLPAPGGPPDGFGTSVASAGDVNGDGFADLIVGAPSAKQFVGVPYVYLGGAGGLSTMPMTLPSLAGPDVELGYSVAGAGDVNADGYADVLVGDAWGDAAFVYLGSASGPTASPLMLMAPAGTKGFGQEVAAAGDVNGDGFADVLVGVPADTTDGAAYLYLGEAGGLSGKPQVLTSSSTSVILSYGPFMAGAGDVNGDGYADVLVAPSYGGALLFLGGSSGPSLAPTTLPNGYSVAGAGDVNGDGYADVLVGAYPPSSADAGAEAAGAYLGGPGGLSTTPEPLTVPGASLTFGFVLASAGDVNGDGFAEVLVGSPSSAGNGAAYVFYGAAAGLPPMASVVLADTSPRTGFGSSLARAGRRRRSR